MNVVIKKDDTYWNGSCWTEWFEFAREYSFNDAAKIVADQFHRLEPEPDIIAARTERQRIRDAKLRLKNATWYQENRGKA